VVISSTEPMARATMGTLHVVPFTDTASSRSKTGHVFAEPSSVGKSICRVCSCACSNDNTSPRHSTLSLSLSLSISLAHGLQCYQKISQNKHGGFDEYMGGFRDNVRSGFGKYTVMAPSCLVHLALTTLLLLFWHPFCLLLVTDAVVRRPSV
jgi:hypothetical protein